MSNKVEDFISIWNLQYPYDYIWRKKYNVPFGSEKHLCMNHIDMLIDLAEDAQIKRMIDESDANELEEMSSGIDLRNKLTSSKQVIPTKQVVKMSKEEIDDEFKNLDISKFND